MERKTKEHWKFFLITFIWSWGLLIIPIILRMRYEEPVTKILFFAAGMAPSATGIFLAALYRDKRYWKDFWHRTLNFRQIGWKWYIIIFAMIPLTSIMAVLLNYVWTKTLPDFTTLKKFIENPISLIPFAIFMFLFGPVAEEIGWRGYALDHLEKSHGWVFSSMILGFFWSAWHFPMFFIGGTYQSDLMSRSFLLFIDFYVAIFAMSIIMDWVYNHNQRSILSGVLVHFCTNFFGELMDLPERVMYIRTAVQIAFAIMILIFYRRSTVEKPINNSLS